MSLWMVAALTLPAAALPVTRERLTRFTASSGLTVTTANAHLVINYFTALRRWRLIALTLSIPLTGVTNDPFYLVFGLFAAFIFRNVRLPPRVLQIPDDAKTYRETWLLGLTGAMAAFGYLLADQGISPALLAHAAIVIIVAAVVPVRRPDARPRPEAPNDIAQAELALGRRSTRTLYLAATAIVVSGALLTPGIPAAPEPPDYSMPQPPLEDTAAFTTVGGYAGPTCPWSDHMNAPCRYWLVNEKPFPQAAPYVIRKGGAPELAPFTRSRDRKAVVYLGKDDRRLTYQNAEGMHSLTKSLADTAVPNPTFAGQSRYLALSKDDTQIIDTRTWTTLSIPGAQKVHTINQSGLVATTATRVLVLDHRGTERMSLPIGKVGDTYHLRNDGDRFVVIRSRRRVETFDPKTGRRLSFVAPVFPNDDSIGKGLGWTAQGVFQIRTYDSERVYNLDLASGRLQKPDPR